MPENTAPTLDRLPKSPGSKIVRAAEESAWRDGFRFLAEAQRVQAAERAKGYAEGKAAGAADATVLIMETAANVDRYLASVEPELAKLAFEIVRRVLGEFDDAELVARAARSALADFREARAVTVKVHPSSEQQVLSALADILPAGEDAVPAVTVETDARLDPRACILSTDIAVIDASIGSQLAAIAKAMGRSGQGAAE